MAEEIVRTRLVVRGRVQGVYFRDSTRECARREGVTGWALNRADGAVEVVLEGGRQAVARVAVFCENGPPHAAVSSVEACAEKPEGLSDFEIR
jgi:acylphosphatase